MKQFILFKVMNVWRVFECEDGRAAFKTAGETNRALDELCADDANYGTVLIVNEVGDETKLASDTKAKRERIRIEKAKEAASKP